MERSKALEALGLTSRATPGEIDVAYRRRAGKLKHAVLRAVEPEEIARRREELRLLVRLRDIALGSERPPPAKLDVSVRHLVDSLRRTTVHELDREAARRFFGLEPTATDDDVQAAYALRKRALVRRYARVGEAREVGAIRRAQGKLRTIRNLAVAPW